MANKNFIQSSGQSLLHPNLCKSTLFYSLLSLLISSTELYPSQSCYTHCIFMLLLPSGLFYIFALSCITHSLVYRVEYHHCLHLGNSTLSSCSIYFTCISFRRKLILRNLGSAFEEESFTFFHSG